MRSISRPLRFYLSLELSRSWCLWGNPDSREECGYFQEHNQMPPNEGQMIPRCKLHLPDKLTRTAQFNLRHQLKRSGNVAAQTGKGIAEVRPATHSLFHGTIKQLFSKAGADISRSCARRNAENSVRIIDIAFSSRRAGAYSNPPQNGDGVQREVLGDGGSSRGDFAFSIGRAELTDLVAGTGSGGSAR